MVLHWKARTKAWSQRTNFPHLEFLHHLSYLPRVLNSISTLCLVSSSVSLLEMQHFQIHWSSWLRSWSVIAKLSKSMACPLLSQLPCSKCIGWNLFCPGLPSRTVKGEQDWKSNSTHHIPKWFLNLPSSISTYATFPLLPLFLFFLWSYNYYGRT